MTEMGLVLLGQQAVISNPAVALLRVSGKNLSHERFSRVKQSRHQKASQAGVEFHKDHRGTAVRLGSSLPAQQPQQLCRISKPIQPLGDRVPLCGGTQGDGRSVARRKSRSNSTSSSSSSSSSATGSQPRSRDPGAGYGAAVFPPSGRSSPYAGAGKAGRSFSAGSVRLHKRRASASEATGTPRDPAGAQVSGRQRRNMSCTSVSVVRAASLEPSSGCRHTAEKRRPWPAPSHNFKCRDRGSQGQKRVSTAEAKARQARMEEFCLAQQRKAIERVEERRRHAIAQRQKAATDELERRHKARERYRIRELEQERRRQHIYALNCVMRRVEARCFEAFKETMERKTNLSSNDDEASESESGMSDCEMGCHEGQAPPAAATVLACRV